MSNNLNIEVKKVPDLEKKFRMIIGGALIVGAALGLSKVFCVLIGGILLATGYLGQCPVCKYLSDKK